MRAQIPPAPKERVLVTGGAGYIGSHIVHHLQSLGHEVVVVDNLSTGIMDRVAGTRLIELDLTAYGSAVSLAHVMKDFQVSSVIHTAAKKSVAGSFVDPGYYWTQNVEGTHKVLRAAEMAGVEKIVFSSSAAVYGEPEKSPITEDSPLQPINPYGETKREGEQLLRHFAAQGIRSVALRFFNVVGAAHPNLGDNSQENLLPKVFDHLRRGKSPVIFGARYATPDGTCVRDYVHVQDVAEAHVAALGYLEEPEDSFQAFNVGTGTGSSVKEVMEAVRQASGIDFTPVIRQARAGDPAALVADVSAIERVLGWRARLSLAEAVQSAWYARVA